jgi:hypothetical protein
MSPRIPAHINPTTLASLALLCSAGAAMAQTNGLQNGSFEQACVFCSPVFPEGWHSPGNSTNSVRRAVGDGSLPTISPVGTPPPAITPHSGSALVQIVTGGAGGFWGVTTDTVNFCYCDQTCGTPCSGPFPFFDPAFDYAQGDVVVSGYYMIPTSDPIVGDSSGIKLEVKYGNYDLATLDPWNGGSTISGTTNGQWLHFTTTFHKADIVNQYECNVGIQAACGCMGCEPAIPPNHCKITIGRFVGDGTPTSGTIYWDDITYQQLPASHCGSADFNCDGDVGTDADIEAFFLCLSGTCPPPPCPSTADFNGDGDVGTDADIEAFFRVLAGGTC